VRVVAPLKIVVEAADMAKPKEQAQFYGVGEKPRERPPAESPIVLALLIQ